MTTTNELVNEEDLKILKQSVYLLESPALITQITNAISEFGAKFIPEIPNGTKNKIVGIAESALHSVFNIANSTMEDLQQDSSPWFHKIAVAASGGVGGLFGLPAILVELPVSTTIMMRSILDIARAEGFSLKEPTTKEECIKVFALEGNKSDKDDNAESGYYTSRLALDRITQFAIQSANEAAAKAAAQAATKAAEQAAAKAAEQAAAKAAEQTAVNTANKATEKTAGDVIIKLIQTVASKFGVTLEAQAAAKLVPALGAVTGATLNTLFINHYQNMAKGHFTVLKLEKKYSQEIIQDLYNRIYQDMQRKKIS